MTDLPLWFKSFVWTEVVLQLPFFFIGSYAWIGEAYWNRGMHRNGATSHLLPNHL